MQQGRINQVDHTVHLEAALPPNSLHHPMLTHDGSSALIANKSQAVGKEVACPCRHVLHMRYSLTKADQESEGDNAPPVARQ